MSNGPSTAADLSRISPGEANLPTHPPVSNVLSALAPAPTKQELSKQALCEAAAHFAVELTQKFPQVVNGELQYAFAGSLAAALLSQAYSFTTFRATHLNNPDRIVVHDNPDSARAALTGMIRPIRDLDFVCTAPSGTCDLGKSALLSNENFSEAARGILKEAQTGRDIILDSVPNELKQDVACVYVLGTPVYIASPCPMLAWKTQLIIENLHGSESNPKYVGDWNALMTATKVLCDQSTLLTTAAEVAHSCAYTAPGTTILPLYAEHATEQLKTFLRDITEVSPSAAIARATGAPEHRLLAITSVLDRFAEGAPRSLVAQAIKRNLLSLDPHEVDTEDPRNIEALATYLRGKPEHLAHFQDALKEHNLEHVIKISPHLFNSHRGNVQFAMIPAPSDLLDTFASALPKTLSTDLALIEATAHTPHIFQNVRKLLSSSAMEDPTLRVAVAQAIIRKPPEKREAFVASLRDPLTELKGRCWVPAPVETVRALLRQKLAANT
jgi:hypothetical protein